MRKKIVLSSLAVGAVSLAAFGALAGDRRHAHWDKMDANGDGELTAEELSARHAELIEKADTNGNGAVSKQEMRAYREARRAEWREKNNPDKNGDGVIDKTEFINAAQDRFDRMDKNGDGVLSEDERKRRRGYHRRGG